jgi:hypothetical protein
VRSDFQLLTALKPVKSPPNQLLAAMPSMTKENLTEAIKGFGETPPGSWNKQQLTARLAELKAEKGMSLEETHKMMVVALNKAAKKKSDWQYHLQHVLKKQITGNETIPKLLALGQQAIQEGLPPTPLDVMGFGVHAEETYENVLKKFPQYAQWCLTTASEEDVNWRMKRFLLWISQQEVGTIYMSETMAKQLQERFEQNKIRQPAHLVGSGLSSGYKSYENTEGSFSLMSSPELKDTWSSEDEHKTEKKVEALEEQIREIRRQQALARKDPKMKIDSDAQELKNRKTGASSQ